jgi:hypothetical protein
VEHLCGVAHPEESSEMASAQRDYWAIVLGIFGLGNLANGFWMIVGPAHWYFNLPAKVPGTGPLNEHFVRDIGCVFLMMGAGLLIGALRPEHRLAAMIGATGWSLLHALVHVYDTARGLLTPDYWLIDLPGVYGPALVLVVLTILVWRSSDSGNEANAATRREVGNG